MTATHPADRRATYLEVLANLQFRVLFVTRVLTITANQLRIVALSVLVFAATNSPLLGAVAFGVGFLPQILGGLFLGAVADKVRPRPLIAIGYSLEGLGAVLLALVPMPVWACLVLVAILACAAPVYSGAMNRVVAEVLTGDGYVLGRSLFTIAASAAQLLGLAAGGLMLAVLGTRHTFLLTAACQMVAALLIRWRLADLPPSESAGSRSAVRRSWATNRQLGTDRVVRRLFLVQWLPPAFVVGVEGLLIPYASVRGFAAGAGAWLLACLPSGMLIGDLVVGRLLQPRTRERLVVALIALLGFPLLALVSNPPLVVTAGLLTLAGTGFSYGLGIQRRFLEALPENTRGQAFGLLGAGLMAVQGAGTVLFGTVAEFVPINLTFALVGVCLLLTAAATHVWLRDKGDNAAV